MGSDPHSHGRSWRRRPEVRLPRGRHVVGSVRLCITGGPHAAGPTSIAIDERMLDSRIVGPMERAAVQAWRKRVSEGCLAGYEREVDQGLREEAIEVARRR